MSTGQPVTPADHIDRAKEQLANGVPDYAVANALIAIAELLAINIGETYAAGVTAGAEVGATAAVDAVASLMGIVVTNGARP